MPIIKCFNRQCHSWDDDEPDNCGKEFLKGPIMECEHSIVRHDPQEKGGDWYYTELLSNECACGKKKKPRKSFCYGDYIALPPYLKDALWQLIGEGYAEAYEEAHKYLDQNVW